VRIARAAAAAAAAVGLGGARAAVARGRAVGVGLVAAVAVVGRVGEVKHVGVGVGRVGQALVAAAAAEAQRVGPGVLAVVGQPGPGTRTVAALGVAAVAVGIEDAAGVGRVFVGDLQDRPGAGAAAAVRIGGVAADGLVQGAAQLARNAGVDVGVVAVVVAITTAAFGDVE